MTNRLLVRLYSDAVFNNRKESLKKSECLARWYQQGGDIKLYRQDTMWTSTQMAECPSRVRQQDVGENETIRMIRTNDEREGREAIMSGEKSSEAPREARKRAVEKRHEWKMMKLQKKLQTLQKEGNYDPN